MLIDGYEVMNGSTVLYSAYACIGRLDLHFSLTPLFTASFGRGEDLILRRRDEGMTGDEKRVRLVKLGQVGQLLIFY
jgi:hypothetical protein